MLQTLKNAWKTVDIRKKLIYTLIILLLYRVGTVIPVPFVNATGFSASFGGTILDYLNTLSGGALQFATLFALGISPYITASIVIQLLTVAIPALERLAQQGEEGKKKINNLTRYATVILAVVTAIGYYFLLKNSGMITTRQGEGVLGAFVIIACYCAGASLVMWLGEKINENGIGNGISIILFANIISGLPGKIIRLVHLCVVGFNGDAPALWGTLSLVFALGYIVLLIAMVVFCVYVTGSERRISVQYAKRVVGRKMYGGQSQNLPLKLNMAGVMPVIFASSIISLPATIMAFCQVPTPSSWEKAEGFWQHVNFLLRSDGWIYPILLFVLIIAFSYFYIQISFNPVEVSNNLKKNGGTILGCRPGAPTADYIRKSLSKITLIGAFFLSVVAIVPIILVPLVMEPLVNAALAAAPDFILDVSYFTSSFAFGGTSLLIVVGVALELVRDIEAQLSMRSYKGFLN
ncbi:MAG: preprotein translocase subunit SecY [Ruminococcaceae bacterium]|nr:preprotein translocase subunit SecY [Oscillospiraceae bacterium]